MQNLNLKPGHSTFHRINERGNYEIWILEDEQETYWETTPDRIRLAGNVYI